MHKFAWQSGQCGEIIVGGTTVETLCFGPAPDNAPTIVMLHEGLGCCALWRDFPQALAQATGCGVFAYSRSGYGKSDAADLPRPLDYMTREATDVLPVVLDTIGVQKAILLGHSDGASIASVYPGVLVDHRVRGLVLMAPHFFTEPLQLDAIAEAKKQYVHGDLRDKLSKYHRNVDNAFHGWNNTWLDPGFESWDITDNIDYWRVPVLAIQGEQDQYGSYLQFEAIERHAYCPVELVLVEHCQHSPHIQQPEITLTAISQFSERLWQLEG